MKKLKNHFKILDDTEYIKSFEFKSNDLISVEIPKSVKEIRYEAFYNNKLTHIEIPKSVKIIGFRAFEHNGLSTIKLCNGLEIIRPYAFSNNLLTSVEIPGSVKQIGYGSFSYNKLTKINILYGVETIKSYAFRDNLLTSVEIPESVKEIGSGAFSKNLLTSVKIPSSVEKIGFNAFDNIEINYNSYIFSKKFVEKYGCENIINVSKILDISPNFNFEIISYSLIKLIPKDNDSIKGYASNYKIFNNLVKQLVESRNINFKKLIDKKSEEYKDFYKMCYTLGLFNTGGIKQKEIIEVIKKMCVIYNIDDIHQMYTDIKLTKYKEKFSEIVLKEYDHPDLIKIITNLYNNYEEISKMILTKRKEQIGILNARYKESRSDIIKQKLEELKTLKKTLYIDDVIRYISENIFVVREQNQKLLKIVGILSTYINQKDFDNIQDIYEKAKVVEKDNLKIFDNIAEENKEDFHYSWLSGDDPINIVLGYICDCCAKYQGAGEDIMIQSMINPIVKNLVIYDSTKNIIGKTTAYYNMKENYILFNTIEIKKQFKKGKKITLNQKKEVLETILRGIKDQIKSMQEKGYVVSDVRIGMLRNDLKEEILTKKMKVVHENLLENYNYKYYAGDANDKTEGQAIVKILK